MARELSRVLSGGQKSGMSVTSMSCTVERGEETTAGDAVRGCLKALLELDRLVGEPCDERCGEEARDGDAPSRLRPLI